jgi:hypothetical protein
MSTLTPFFLAGGMAFVRTLAIAVNSYSDPDFQIIFLSRLFRGGSRMRPFVPLRTTRRALRDDKGGRGAHRNVNGGLRCGA